MWTDSVTINEIRRRQSWKAEFFLGEKQNAIESSFDILPLQELVIERKASIDPQTEPNRVVDYIGLEHIQSVTGDLVNFEPREIHDVKSRSKVFCTGDILYGRLRAYLNKVYLAEGTVDEGICSVEFFVLIPRLDNIRPHLLRMILTSQYVQQYAGRWQTGSALPRLQLRDLLSIQVPVPPLSEQDAYEEYIICMEGRRRRLAAALARLPAQMLDGVTTALEAGTRPPLIPQEDRADRTVPD
jgi:restriction endonuclease S subunit